MEKKKYILRNYSRKIVNSRPEELKKIFMKQTLKIYKLSVLFVWLDISLLSVWSNCGNGIRYTPLWITGNGSEYIGAVNKLFDCHPFLFLKNYYLFSTYIGELIKTRIFLCANHPPEVGRTWFMNSPAPAHNVNNLPELSGNIHSSFSDVLLGSWIYQRSKKNRKRPRICVK